MSSGASNWCTIESDPGIFTELIQRMGIRDVEVDELWSLESEFLSTMKPAYGLIFLFKWTGEEDNRPTLSDAEKPEKLFFARQVINNACATQAILACLLNAGDRVDLGEDMKNFVAFTQEFPAEMKGEAIGANESIRVIHNSFQRPEPFLSEEAKSAISKKEQEEAYHFVAYVPFEGVVYELDGLKKGPIALTKVEEGRDWLDVVKPHIEERMAKYQEGEIHFNLMALIRDRRKVAQDKIEALEMQALSGGGADEHAMAEAHAELIEAKSKHETWAAENERTKHNYVPFTVAILRELAKKSKLPALIEAGKEVEAKRRASGKKTSLDMDVDEE